MLGSVRGVFATAIFIAVFPIPVFSQTGDVTDNSPLNVEFERLSMEEGLSNANVVKVLRDIRGFLWIATRHGLNRYDGYGFTVYEHDPYSLNSLSHNDLTTLCEDRQGTLWVGT